MRKQHNYYVYIITNPNRTVLYIGVTNNLARRLVEHYANKGKRKTFAGRYYAYSLVYYEHFQYILQAIAREKEIKKWNRQRKEALIATSNPNWTFYNDKICGEWPPSKTWGTYLEQFKQRKAKDATTGEEPTLHIYQEELETIPIQTKASSTISDTYLPSKSVAIEQQIIRNHQLSKRERLLLNIALFILLDQQEELSLLFKDIPRNTVTKEDVEAVLVQVGFYAGFPVLKRVLGKFEGFFGA